MMKKTILYLTLASFTLVMSCKKYEQTPLNQYAIDDIFDSTDIAGASALQFLNNIYNNLPKPGSLRIGFGVLDGGTDDATTSSLNSSAESLATGKWGLSVNPDDAWAINYQGIRKVNTFLANIDKVPITATQKSIWKAESRFLRAIFYFELVKRYGGVPLIADKIISVEEDYLPARNSYDDCVNYIVSECNAIESQLRTDPIAAADLGRPTLVASMALKSRTLLYAASPLNNPNNDIAKWQAAATAAKSIISLNKYSLVANFVNVFVTRQNTEVIFAFQRAKTNDLERGLAPIGYTNPNQSTGYVSPSQNLVDSYPSLNGLAINDPLNTSYDPENPYTNRDPRLASTVFTNGTSWLGRPVELFEGGKDKPGGTIIQSRTGYYMKKFLANMATATAYSTQDHNYTIFRYAEILLNYAEAINESGIGTQQNEALIQLYAIRKRAGIVLGTMAGYQYGLKNTMTQTELRTAIRLERRLEMAFEEQRFWDIRRWKVAEEIMNNKPLRGVSIVKNPISGKLTYTPFTLFNMVFQPKMYNYPILYTEIVKNPKLTQTAGW